MSNGSPFPRGPRDARGSERVADRRRPFARGPGARGDRRSISHAGSRSKARTRAAESVSFVQPLDIRAARGWRRVATTRRRPPRPGRTRRRATPRWCPRTSSRSGRGTFTTGARPGRAFPPREGASGLLARGGCRSHCRSRFPTGGRPRPPSPLHPPAPSPSHRPPPSFPFRVPSAAPRARSRRRACRFGACW